MVAMAALEAVSGTPPPAREDLHVLKMKLMQVDECGTFPVPRSPHIPFVPSSRRLEAGRPFGPAPFAAIAGSEACWGLADS